MNRAVIKWQGGCKVIQGAKLGDSRVKQELDRLATLKAKNVSLTFEDDFDIGRHIDDEEVYD